MPILGNKDVAFKGKRLPPTTIQELKDSCVFYLSFDNWQPFFSQGDYISEIPFGVKQRIRTGDPRSEDSLFGSSHDVASNNNRTLNIPSAVFYDNDGDIPFTLNFYYKSNNISTDQGILRNRNFGNGGFNAGYIIKILNGNLIVTLYSSSTEQNNEGQIKFVFPLINYLFTVFNSFMISYNGNKSKPVVNLYLNAIKIDGTIDNKNYSGMNNDIGASQTCVAWERLTGKVEEFSLSRNLFVSGTSLAIQHHNDGAGLKLFN